MTISFLPQLDYITIIDHLGTFAFAISGLRLAATKDFDWFGAYVIGFVTATGGGTVRDLLLGLTPFWMVEPSYLIITGVALLVFLFLSQPLTKIGKTIFIFDTIGLGLFVVVGIEKTLGQGFPFWVAVIMGTITGCIGGVVRDVLINEPPLIFRQDIYASACILGGLVYWLLDIMNLPNAVVSIAAALGVVTTRILVVKLGIQIPSINYKKP